MVAGGGGQEALPLMGLRSLRISAPPPATMRYRPPLGWDSLSSAANSSTDSSDTDDRCDSSLGDYELIEIITLIRNSLRWQPYLEQYNYWCFVIEIYNI